MNTRTTHGPLGSGGPAGSMIAATPERLDALIRRGRTLRSQAAVTLLSALARPFFGLARARRLRLDAAGGAEVPPHPTRETPAARGPAPQLLDRRESWVAHEECPAA